MDDEWERLTAPARERIRANAPKCLGEFRLSSTEDPTGRSDEDVVTSWRLACGCEHGHGRVLGYSLHDFNASYRGPFQFVRPLHFECAECGRVTLIVDEHGYHSEVARLEGGVGSATFRGTGPTAPYCCQACEATDFAVTVSLIYSDGAFDLFLDEPELPAEDFFDIIDVRGQCQECGNSCVIASFEG